MILKSTLRILFTIFCVLFSSLYVHAANLTNIQILDKSSLNLMLTGSVNIPTGEINSEIKLFKDIEIASTLKDLNVQKITLNLSGSLQNNKTYTLLPILLGDITSGGEDTLDFTTSSGALVNIEIPFNQGIVIKKMIIKNSNTIEVYFSQNISKGEFEFKLLNEIKITSQTYLSNNLSIFLGDNLEEYSNYIIMLLSIKDSFGKDIIFDDYLYNFSSTNLQNSTVSDIKTGMIKSENGNTNSGVLSQVLSNVIEKPHQEPIILTGSMIKTQTGNIEEVALNSAHTPDTGAETWIMVLLTFIINTVFIFRKKIL